MEDKLVMEGIHKNYIKTKELNRIKALERARRQETILKKIKNNINYFFNTCDEDFWGDLVLDFLGVFAVACLGFILVILKVYF